jgi:hypothetical protein
LLLELQQLQKVLHHAQLRLPMTAAVLGMPLLLPQL